LQAGDAGYRKVRLHHSSESAASAIETVIADVAVLPRKTLGRVPNAPLVTVVIPNYNHQRFLKERLDSVAKQSFSNIEIIVLDDASTDNSRSTLEAFVATDLRARLICNEANSGSTFKQWRKGLAAAQGKYIWIAESDDAAQRNFLAQTVKRLEADSSIAIAHTQSMMTNVDGASIGKPDGWLNDLEPGRWDADFIADGVDEILKHLCQKNTIPNASAVVFRNFSGIEYLVDDTMRLCADWLFWIRLLARGKYAFIAKSLNLWRQNSSNARTHYPGVIEWEEGQRILGEIAGMLNLTQTNREQMLERFHQRCKEWSGGRIT
jgi:glycosyltransferase involved in cell wall biosynthesis